MSDRSLFQSDFPPEEFRERRAKIFEAIGASAHAVLQGAAPERGFEIFRQSNDFYYCCGIEVPQAYLLLSGSDRSTTLYLPHRPEGHSSEGESLAAEDAEMICEAAGLDGVFGPEALAEHLAGASVVYTSHGPAEGPKASRGELNGINKRVAADPWDGQPSREDHFIGLLRTRLPAAEIRDLTPVINRMRGLKSPREIALLREAGRLTALAVTEAMRATKPGMVEYQLAAIAQHVYLTNGARGEGYRAIIASGPNAWHGHYFRNNRTMRDGDLVLMDVAPDFHYYTSDIGRMWPVGGVYAPWQRELYGFMVEYHKVLLGLIRPGATADEIHAAAAAQMAKVIDRTRFSKPVFEAAARRTLEFKGHLSHPVGMAVHDVGGYGGDGPARETPLRPGVVFTVDPQMWIPEERLYIRCEDTVVVTDGGIENLTAAAPLELDDVERAMREEGAYARVTP